MIHFLSIIGTLLIAQLVCFCLFKNGSGGNDGDIGLAMLSIVGGGAGCMMLIAAIVAWMVQ